jgi:hypothetical protein
MSQQSDCEQCEAEGGPKKYPAFARLLKIKGGTGLLRGPFEGVDRDAPVPSLGRRADGGGYCSSTDPIHDGIPVA